MTRTTKPLPPIAKSGMTWMQYAAEELRRDPTLKIDPSPAAVMQARDAGGLRWERVAVYAGVTVAQARRLYEEAAGRSYRTSHTGRGRNFAKEFAAAQKPKRRRAKRTAEPAPAEEAA